MVDSFTKIGVLSLQGDFFEHISAIKECGAVPVQVKRKKDLNDLSGLIIPGGESTTIAKLIDVWDMRFELTQFAKSGRAVWGTCAGMILLSKNIEDDNTSPLGLMDFHVKRNFFGRQIDSFEEELAIKGLDEKPFRAVFIRAPSPTWYGKKVDPLAFLETKVAVALAQENLLATAFHPELTNDYRVHKMFIDMAKAV